MQLLLLPLLLPLLVAASPAPQDGSVTPSDGTVFTYSCDASKCQLPNCQCASTSIPGGLSPADTPMFVLFTADDAVQTYTINSVNQFLAHRQNPNGCPVKMTFFTSLGYTNYANVTEFYVAGNEIADHTMSHVAQPTADEINGNLIALNALSGIPLRAIKGFRAPYLNFTANTLKILKDSQFLYDSSATSSVPVTNPNTDAYWPYTLDYGLANSCHDQATGGTVCNGEPKLPGLWEIPMYSIFDERGVSGVHLMDPWLDMGPSGAVNVTATLTWMQNTFSDHYKGNRQPFGLYTHPIHVAPGVPGVSTPNATVNMINQFLDWAQQQQNVWIVTNEQLLDWVRNPVPASQLNNLDSFKCAVPQVDAKICNGIPGNQDGLVGRCQFPDFPFSTCYGCPERLPTPGEPNPPQATPLDGSPIRFRIPANCSTPFWDPIGNKCLCTSSQCAFVDHSRPIGPNGANLTGGGTGGGPDGAAATTVSPYKPFNGNAASALEVMGLPFWTSLGVGIAGVLLGAGSLMV